MTDSSPATPRRSRSQILVLLGVVLAGVLVYMMWPAAAGRPPAPSNPPREQKKQASPGKAPAGTPESLNVQLETLKQTPPAPDEAARNPFRFYVKPPPPPPPPPKPVVVPPPPGPGEPGFVPPPPPAPPPIPLKFIGRLEVKGRTVAIFTSTDGRGMPQYAAEGELVLGQYRVVKIGIESVTLEYLDGRGRQTMR